MPKRKHISKSTRLKVYEKYNGHCAYCGCELALKEMQVHNIQSVYWYDGANDSEGMVIAYGIVADYLDDLEVILDE